MGTNITITSDDVVKSQVISDTIAQALEEKGFMNLTCTHSAPFQEPRDVLHKFRKSRSVLEQIQDSYPDFFAEPITLRAVPVIGYDKNSPRVEALSDNITTEVAFLTVNSANHEGDVVIAFKEQGHKPPPILERSPDVDKVMDRQIEKMRSNPEMHLTFADAARELHLEGKLENGIKLQDQLGAIEQNIGLQRVVEEIENETFYGTPEGSPAIEAVRRNAHRDSKVHQRRAEMHLVDAKESLAKAEAEHDQAD